MTRIFTLDYIDLESCNNGYIFKNIKYWASRYYKQTMRFFKLRTNLINILFDVIAHFHFHGTIYISGTHGFKRYQGKTKWSLRRIKFNAFIGKLISVNAFYILWHAKIALVLCFALISVMNTTRWVYKRHLM